MAPNPYSGLNKKNGVERRKVPVRRHFLDLNENVEGANGAGSDNNAAGAVNN